MGGVYYRVSRGAAFVYVPSTHPPNHPPTTFRNDPIDRSLARYGTSRFTASLLMKLMAEASSPTHTLSQAHPAPTRAVKFDDYDVGLWGSSTNKGAAASE